MELTETETKRRPHCEICDRPLRVCLCSCLPPSPLAMQLTHVFVLHHPHEARHKLATVPILRLCLSNCHVLVGRKFVPGCFPLLDILASQPIYSQRPPYQALLLFPSSEATDLHSWLLAHRSLACDQCDNVYKKLQAPEAFSEVEVTDPFDAHFILLVFDATWKHAKEMVTASLPFLRNFVTQVCLPYNANSSQLILRKEPFAGCVSTMEAVASCLKLLEPNGLEIEEKLLSVLRAMVQFQASHISVPKIRRILPKRNT